jgi:soluble lytic murein transglycosylase-like protein
VYLATATSREEEELAAPSRVLVGFWHFGYGRQFGGSVPLALAAYNAGPAPVVACDCVPSIPETQAYVARILGLLGGAGELVTPTLEVRLVD